MTKDSIIALLMNAVNRYETRKGPSSNYIYMNNMDYLDLISEMNYNMLMGSGCPRPFSAQEDVVIFGKTIRPSQSCMSGIIQFANEPVPLHIPNSIDFIVGASVEEGNSDR